MTETGSSAIWKLDHWVLVGLLEEL